MEKRNLNPFGLLAQPFDHSQTGYAKPDGMTTIRL